MNLKKKALREQLIEDTDKLPDDYIRTSNDGIYNVVKNLPEFIEAKTIFAYYSLAREPDTIKLLKLALEQGKTVTLPVCFKGGVMEARVIKDFNSLTESSYHLLEPHSSTQIIPPEDLDFIIVPALTYDKQGYRIGRGGGYYDRFLCTTGAYTVGLARECLIYDAVPCEKHDIPVKCVVTEKKARLHCGASQKERITE